MKEVTIYENEQKTGNNETSFTKASERQAEVRERVEVEIDVAKETKVQEIKKQLEEIQPEVTTEPPHKGEHKSDFRDIRFYGQHADERILYEVRPHPLAIYLSLTKAVLAGVVVWFALVMVGRAIPKLADVAGPLGFWAGLGLAAVGIVAVKYAENKQVAFITDRRVIRFSGANPWAINTRSLTWDEAVKVKTYPNNLIWRLLNIGTVTVHAKSTIVNLGEAPITSNVVTNDDIELTHVWFYRDLGNYIDKILFMYKQKPKELETLRPFMTKGRGRRD